MDLSFNRRESGMAAAFFMCDCGENHGYVSIYKNEEKTGPDIFIPLTTLSVAKKELKRGLAHRGVLRKETKEIEEQVKEAVMEAIIKTESAQTQARQSIPA